MGPWSPLITLSPCVVSSVSPSDRYSQFSLQVPILRRISRLLKTHPQHLTSCVFPPSNSSFFPLDMPASYPFSYRLLASHGQRTSSSDLLPSVSSQRHISSFMSNLHQYRFVCSLLSPREPQHSSPDPHFAGINFLLHFSCLCPCLATIKYHQIGHCFCNSCFCLQTHMFDASGKK